MTLANVVVLVALAAPASAASAAVEPAGSVRVLHAWPGAPAIAVEVDDRSTELGYGELSPYMPVPAGVRPITVRGAQPSPMRAEVTIDAGMHVTVLVGPADHDGRRPAVATIVDEFPTVGGKAAVRFVMAAPDLTDGIPHVDGEASPLVELLDAGSYTVIDAGPTTLSIRAPEGTTLRDVETVLADGAVYTVVAYGFGERPVVLESHLDATGAREVPLGYVATGVPPDTASRDVGAVSFIAVAIAVLAWAAWRARRARRRRGRRWLLLPVLVLVALLVGAGCSGSTGGGPNAARDPRSTGDRPGAVESPGTWPQASGDPSEAESELPTVEGPSASSRYPTNLQLPTLGEAGPVRSLGTLADGTLDVPDSARELGWFAQSAVPGEAGPSVLVGHVNDAFERGVLAPLDDLQPGDPVVVALDDGNELTFRITGVEHHVKEEFPTDRVYGPTPNSELRLVTCGGSITTANDGRRAFTHNVIAFAVLDEAAASNRPEMTPA